MLTWERYHRNNDLEWPIRPDGGGEAIMVCCLIRLDDPGANTSEILRLDDDGSGTSCIQPLSCEE